MLTSLAGSKWFFLRCAFCLNHYMSFVEIKCVYIIRHVQIITCSMKVGLYVVLGVCEISIFVILAWTVYQTIYSCF